MRVAFLGPAGTFSEDALRASIADARIDAQPAPTVYDAIRAVRVVTAKIADAAVEGLQRRESDRADIDYTIEPGEYSFAPDDEEI